MIRANTVFILIFYLGSESVLSCGEPIAINKIRVALFIKVCFVTK